MESIGAKLSNARSEKGVSIEQAARDTHIAKRFIEAMEQENFDEFPGEAYLLGFLRNYAGYLGLSAEEVVTLYHNIRLQEQPAPIDELLDRKPSAHLPPRILIGALVVVAVAAVVTLFVTGVISLPQRRASTSEADSSNDAENTLITLDDQFVERRFVAGDRVSVPVDGDRAILEFVAIDDRISVGSEAGIVHIGGREERVIDLTGEGSGDVRLAVREIYPDDSPPAVVARLDRVVNGERLIADDNEGQMTDNDVTDLATGMTNVPERERPAQIIAEFSSQEEYFLEADFRGLTMFRWAVDGEPREERYVDNGDRIQTSVEEIARIWASNAGNVRLQIAGNSVELGDQGEVVAAVVRWRELDSANYALEVLPLY
ncbi:MAG: helix-turn-helix domain-containing protein [Alkalispirochaeta sp.]